MAGTGCIASLEHQLLPQTYPADYSVSSQIHMQTGMGDSVWGGGVYMSGHVSVSSDVC